MKYVHTHTLYLFSRIPCASVAITGAPFGVPRYNAPPASGRACESTCVYTPSKRRALLSQLAIQAQCARKQPQFLSTTCGLGTNTRRSVSVNARPTEAHRRLWVRINGGSTSRGRHAAIQNWSYSGHANGAHQRLAQGSCAGGGSCHGSKTNGSPVGTGAPPPTDVSAEEAPSLYGPGTAWSLPSSCWLPKLLAS